MKVAVFWPAGIVMGAGAATEGLLLANVIYDPPLGAGELSVMVPVEDAPPTTVAGLTEIEVT